ncbi:MAG: hypothetical protein ACR2P8_11620, partial [Myxococcota bacterium]
MPRRLVLPWLLACAVILGLLGLAPAARSDTLWWIAAGGDDRASDAMNWSTHPIHGHRLPGGDLNVYVTTADHHGIRPGELAAWPRLSGGDLTTGNFYVGG